MEFYYDALGTYIRGTYYGLYQACFISSLVFLIVCLVIVGRRFRHRDLFTIIMILVVMAAALLPLLLSKVYTNYLGIGMCASLCYIYYNDLTQEDIRDKLIADQKKLFDMQTHTISGMANLIENRDMETGEHVARTSRYVRALSEFARADHVYADQMTDHFIAQLYRVAPLHDVGKIVVPDDILKKPGSLTEPEFNQIKRHASEGGRVIREVLGGVAEDEYLALASDIAAWHHERWDGKGYPNGLSGEEIPLSARIMAIADVYDALISERCYKKALSTDEAFQIMQQGAGTHFNPNLIGVLLNHRKEWNGLLP